MIRVDPARTAIVVAGAATAGMGAFHFFLPQLFGWSRFTDALPAEIRWALFAINAFLSLLLLAGGVASIMTSRRTTAATRWPIWTMAAFWLFNTIYQVIWPFPTSGVRWALLGFGLVMALLYLAGLFLARRAED
ncbi:MAG: hypothetical protein HY040_01220 [Planctomycetes bacterium]|nr:hypothetical protein [Planctomycetota bacterium]